MAKAREYAYYMKGGRLQLVEKSRDVADGLNYTYNDGDGLDLPSGTGSWKSPLETIPDALRIEYAYSPTYFIRETEDTSKAIDQYRSDAGYLLLEDIASNDFSTAPESLADGSYIVLRGAGRWNGLHKVSAAGAGSITTYTKYDGDGTDSVVFEGTVTLYYNVDVLNDEADELDIPEYLSKAVVDYVKARLAEDVGELELKDYFMKEFRKKTEKYENAKIVGPRMIVPGVRWS